METGVYSGENEQFGGKLTLFKFILPPTFDLCDFWPSRSPLWALGSSSGKIVIVVLYQMLLMPCLPLSALTIPVCFTLAAFYCKLLRIFVSGPSGLPEYTYGMGQLMPWEPPQLPTGWSGGWSPQLPDPSLGCPVIEPRCPQQESLQHTLCWLLSLLCLFPSAQLVLPGIAS